MRELRRRKLKDLFTVRVSINIVLLTRCLSWQVSSAVSVVNSVQLMNQVFNLLKVYYITSHSSVKLIHLVRKALLHAVILAWSILVCVHNSIF